MSYGTYGPPIDEIPFVRKYSESLYAREFYEILDDEDMGTAFMCFCETMCAGAANDLNVYGFLPTDLDEWAPL